MSIGVALAVVGFVDMAKRYDSPNILIKGEKYTFILYVLTTRSL